MVVHPWRLAPHRSADFLTMLRGLKERAESLASASTPVSWAVLLIASDASLRPARDVGST